MNAANVNVDLIKTLRIFTARCLLRPTGVFTSHRVTRVRFIKSTARGGFRLFLIPYPTKLESQTRAKVECCFDRESNLAYRSIVRFLIKCVNHSQPHFKVSLTFMFASRLTDVILQGNNVMNYKWR